MSVIKLKKRTDFPRIEVTEEVIGNPGLSGFTNICDIEVKMSDGTYACFFVSAAIRNNRPVVELATNTNMGSTRKRVTGIKMKESS